MTNMDQWIEECCAAGWNPRQLAAVRQVAIWAQAQLDDLTLGDPVYFSRYMTEVELDALALLQMAFLQAPEGPDSSSVAEA